MSGAIKTVKKVFKKIVKPVLIGAAIYFTAGLALSAIPATSSIAASLPGFAGGGIAGTGVGAGATAGTGVFSKVASTIGLGGGLAAGAAKAGTTAAALTGTFGAKTALAATGAAPNAAAVTGAAAGALSSGAASGAGAAVGAGKALSLADKLLLAKVGTDVVTAAVAPDPGDLLDEEAQFRGAFYGAERGGPPLPAPGEAQAAPQQSEPLISPPGGGQEASPSLEQRQIQRGRDMRTDLFPQPQRRQENPETPGLFGTGQMQQQVEIPDNVFAPASGVRYVGGAV